MTKQMWNQRERNLHILPLAAEWEPKHHGEREPEPSCLSPTSPSLPHTCFAGCCTSRERGHPCWHLCLMKKGANSPPTHVTAGDRGPGTRGTVATAKWK